MITKELQKCFVHGDFWSLNSGTVCLQLAVYVHAIGSKNECGRVHGIAIQVSYLIRQSMGLVV